MVTGTRIMVTTLASRKGGSAVTQGVEAITVDRAAGTACRGRGCAHAPGRARSASSKSLEHGRDHVGDLVHLGLAHAPGGHRGRAEAQAVGVERARAVAGEAIGVDRDAHLVEAVLRGATAHPEGSKVDDHQVVVGPTGDQLDTAGGEAAGQSRRVGDDLLRVHAELRLHALQEHDRLGGDGVHLRATLRPREHGLVECVGVLRAAEDDPAPRAAHGLVRGERHEVGVGDRRGMRPAGHQPGEVRHVHHQQGADVARDVLEGSEVEEARVRAVPGDDHRRGNLVGPCADLVVVDATVGVADGVGLEVVELAAEVDGGAVGEVAALVQRHAEHRVAGLHDAGVHGGVRLRAGMRLHVGVVRAEQLLAALARQVLDLVDDLAAAVVALAREALGVLVVEPGSERLEDGDRREVLGRDELERLLLAGQLLVHERRHRRVGGAQGRFGREPAVDAGAGMLLDCHLSSTSWRQNVMGSVRQPCSNSVSLWLSIGPSRRTRTGATLQSMIVEAIPPGCPPLSTAPTSSPNSARRAATSASGGSPWRFALVVARGPLRRSRSRSSAWSGTRTASVVP